LELYQKLTKQSPNKGALNGKEKKEKGL